MTMDDEIIPMSDEEIEAAETNTRCPECGGDGADMEDSSKDCDGCRGTGLMSVYLKRLRPPRTSSLDHGGRGKDKP